MVKDPAVSEVFRLYRGPTAENRIINRDQVELWEVRDQRLIGDRIGLGRTVVVPGRDGLADISFTVPRTSVEQARRVLRNLAGELGGEVKDEPKVAILTVKGVGIRSHTGVGLRMFKALAEAAINVEMVSTSEIRVNVVIGADKAAAGLAALKNAFADVLG